MAQEGPYFGPKALDFITITQNSTFSALNRPYLSPSGWYFSPEGTALLQSNYGLGLKIVVLNSILYAKGSYNDVVS